MKKTITTITFVMAVLAISLTFSSCKKGDTGPVGPTGSNGINGTNGTNGVANIQTSTITTTNASWNILSSPYNYAEADFTYSAITSEVVSGGAVLIYMQSGADWSALPFSVLTTQWGCGFTLNGFYVRITFTDNSVPANPGGRTFKVVVIPPAMVKPNVNIYNYNDVKAAYNLAD